MILRKKYRRDYIILEPKDLSFRQKDKLVPKAFAKIEFKDDKTSCMIYAENLRCIQEGYRVTIVDSDLNSKDVGRVLINEGGKGEFTINVNDDVEVKAVAITHKKEVVLIGFKGSVVEKYEDVIFREEEIKNITTQSQMDEDTKQETAQEIVEESFRDEDSKKKEIEENTPEEETFRESDVQEEIEVLHYEPYPTEQTNRDERYTEETNREENTEQLNMDETVDDRVYLIPRGIKKHLNNHKEVIPFDAGEDDIRWWKIDMNPVSMYSYNMPYLGYINFANYTFYSETTSLAFKYKHYLYGIKYCEKGKRKYYIYAVPGTRNERPDEGSTGFVHFVPCSRKDNSYGYWLCYIDCKSRLVALDGE